MCFRPPEITVKEVICPQCGAVNHPEDADCYQCSTSLEGVEAGNSADAFGDGGAAGIEPPAVPSAPKVPGAPAPPSIPKVPGGPSDPAVGKVPGSNT